MKLPDYMVTHTPNGTPIAHIASDISDNGIDNLIRMTLPSILQKDTYWVCAISGYEYDERELYEVAEVRAFCRRLVERGFIASLHVSTLLLQEELPELETYLGGVEIWAIGENMLTRTGDFQITSEIFEQFALLLNKAEKRAVALVRPQDGQHGASVLF